MVPDFVVKHWRKYKFFSFYKNIDAHFPYKYIKQLLRKLYNDAKKNNNLRYN